MALYQNSACASVTRLINKITEIKAELTPVPPDLVSRLEKVPLSNWKANHYDDKNCDHHNVWGTSEDGVNIKLDERPYALASQITITLTDATTGKELLWHHGTILKGSPVYNLIRNIGNNYVSPEQKKLESFLKG